jgi:hypothetical protein
LKTHVFVAVEKLHLVGVLHPVKPSMISTG